MKCPHCGMNIRDNIVECGYCGGQISQSSGKSSAAGGRTIPKESSPKKGTKATKPQDKETESEDEEEGGLSPYLQPGEQVRIGSLNVSVKKFFFHAYLTDKRIFLIDTQEKKLKVTAKDVARDTIAGCTSEFSENSDPVLVVSIRSPDEEIKTMKIVFVQNGMDRSTEIDEWISLLQDERPNKKSSKKKIEKPAPQDEEPAFAAPAEKPAVREGLHPTRKPAKDHEKQPPVKRLLSIYKVPAEEEKEPEPIEEEPPRRSPVRQQEPARKSISIKSYDQEIPVTQNEEEKPARKPEVQSAMKVAMKSAMQPLRQQASHPVRKVTAEPIYRQPVPEPEHAPFVEILPDEPLEVEEKPARGEAGNPQFCHNCGKKLPHNANFCPGCGTKLSAHKSGQAAASAPAPAHGPSHTSPAASQRKVPKIMVSASDEDDEDANDTAPAPVKPPIKKAPPGSEMTILHKFLRR